MTSVTRRKRSLFDLGIPLLALSVAWIVALVTALALLVPAFQVAVTLLVFVAPAGYWLWQRYAAFFDVARERALRLNNPVLFLRPFSKDDRKVERGFESLGWSVALGPLGRWWYALLLRKTPEEQIERATMAALGPMVALGSPQDRMPRSGALRVYASDDEWQDVVRTFVSRSQAVFMMAGTTAALTWELNHLRNAVEPTRVFIFTEPPDTTRDRWSAILRTFEDAGWTLPQRDPGPGAVIGFDEQWRPAVLAQGEDDAGKLVAAVIAWRAEPRAVCPECRFLLDADECTRCVRSAGTDVPDPQSWVRSAPDALPAGGARELLGERRVSDRFGPWVLPLFGRMRLRGLRVATALLLMTIAFATTLALGTRVPLAAPAFFLILLTSATLLVAFGAWSLRRLPARRILQQARQRGFSAAAIEQLAAVIDRRAAVIGAESGKHLGSAILIEAPFPSMIATLEDRAIESIGGKVADPTRRREVIGGVAYDIVEVVKGDGTIERLHFELAHLDLATHAEDVMTAEPGGGDFLRDVVSPAIPRIRQLPGIPASRRIALGLLTLVAVAALLGSLFGAFLMMIADGLDARVTLARWVVPVWLAAPSLLLACRRLRRTYAVEWRYGGEALLDLRSNVRPSDASYATAALIGAGSIVLLVVFGTVIADGTARRELRDALEQDHKAATAALLSADLRGFEARTSSLSTRLERAVSDAKIDPSEARDRSVLWERTERTLLLRRFEELLPKAVEHPEEAERLGELLRKMNLPDHAARVAAAAKARQERLATRGLHVKLVAGDDASRIDDLLLESLTRPVIAAMRAKLDGSYDIIEKPRSKTDQYAATVEIRVDAELLRFSPQWWTGDDEGPSADAPPEIRKLFAAIPVKVRYITSVIDGRDVPEVENWDFTIGPLPTTNPRLDTRQEETTETSEWAMDDAHSAVTRNLKLLEEEVDRRVGARRQNAAAATPETLVRSEPVED